jgi:hypothetical protein
MSDNSSRKDWVKVTILALGVTTGAIIYFAIRYS